MKKHLHFTVIALLAAGMLILGGCSEEIEDDEPIAPALAGNWSNNAPEEINVRTFTIEKNGSFSATLNPGGTMGWGTVTGKLTKDGNSYIMSSMKETTGASWAEQVSLYNGTVQIEFPNNNTFTLTSANGAVQMFFGGTYTRQP